MLYVECYLSSACVIHYNNLLALQVTPASSLWEHVWSPTTPVEHSSSLPSVPLQPTSLSQIEPLPWPNIALLSPWAPTRCDHNNWQINKVLSNNPDIELTVRTVLQLFADYFSIAVVPVIITDGSPLVVVTQLHSATSSRGWAATSKPHVTRRAAWVLNIPINNYWCN
jgi:hypothetical protein